MIAALTGQDVRRIEKSCTIAGDLRTFQVTAAPVYNGDGDVVAGQPSILLQREIYVTAAIVGAVVTVVLSHHVGLNGWIAGGSGALAAFAIRAGALTRGWKLPIHPG